MATASGFAAATLGAAQGGPTARLAPPPSGVAAAAAAAADAGGCRNGSSNSRKRQRRPHVGFPVRRSRVSVGMPLPAWPSSQVARRHPHPLCHPSCFTTQVSPTSQPGCAPSSHRLPPALLALALAPPRLALTACPPPCSPRLSAVAAGASSGGVERRSAANATARRSEGVRRRKARTACSLVSVGFRRTLVGGQGDGVSAWRRRSEGGVANAAVSSGRLSATRASVGFGTRGSISRSSSRSSSCSCGDGGGSGSGSSRALQGRGCVGARGASYAIQWPSAFRSRGGRQAVSEFVCQAAGGASASGAAAGMQGDDQCHGSTSGGKNTAGDRGQSRQWEGRQRTGSGAFQKVPLSDRPDYSNTLRQILEDVEGERTDEACVSGGTTGGDVHKRRSGSNSDSSRGNAGGCSGDGGRGDMATVHRHNVAGRRVYTTRNSAFVRGGVGTLRAFARGSESKGAGSAPGAASPSPRTRNRGLQPSAAAGAVVVDGPVSPTSSDSEEDLGSSKGSNRWSKTLTDILYGDAVPGSSGPMDSGLGDRERMKREAVDVGAAEAETVSAAEVEAEIEAALSQRRTETAVRLLWAARARGFVPNSRCWSRCVAQLSLKGDVVGAAKVLEEAEEVRAAARRAEQQQRWRQRQQPRWRQRQWQEQQGMEEVVAGADVEVDANAMGILIQAASKSKHFSVAERSLALMLERQQPPPVRVWSALVSAMGRQAATAGRALAVFDRMLLLASAVRANDEAAVLDGPGVAGAGSSSRSSSSGRRDSRGSGGGGDGTARGGSGESWRPDTGAFNAGMNAAVVAGDVARAEELLRERMPALGVEPDFRSFNILLKGYAAQHDSPKMMAMYQYMQDQGVHTDASTVNTLVAAFVAQGDLAAAEVVVRDVAAHAAPATAAAAAAPAELPVADAEAGAAAGVVAQMDSLGGEWVGSRGGNEICIEEETALRSQVLEAAGARVGEPALSSLSPASQLSPPLLSSSSSSSRPLLPTPHAAALPQPGTSSPSALPSPGAPRGPNRDSPDRMPMRTPVQQLGPTVRTFTTLLKGYIESDNWPKAIALFEWMKAQPQSAPNEVTYCTLINALVSQALLLHNSPPPGTPIAIGAGRNDRGGSVAATSSGKPSKSSASGGGALGTMEGVGGSADSRMDREFGALSGSGSDPAGGAARGRLSDSSVAQHLRKGLQLRLPDSSLRSSRSSSSSNRRSSKCRNEDLLLPRDVVPDAEPFSTVVPLAYPLRGEPAAVLEVAPPPPPSAAADASSAFASASVTEAVTATETPATFSSSFQFPPAIAGAVAEGRPLAPWDWDSDGGGFALTAAPVAIRSYAGMGPLSPPSSAGVVPDTWGIHLWLDILGVGNAGWAWEQLQQGQQQQQQQLQQQQQQQRPQYTGRRANLNPVLSRRQDWSVSESSRSLARAGTETGAAAPSSLSIASIPGSSLQPATSSIGGGAAAAAATAEAAAVATLAADIAASLTPGSSASAHMVHALRLLGEMQQRRVPLSAMAFNTVMKGLCGLGQQRAARRLLRCMEDLGVGPTAATFNTLIHAECEAGRADGALSWLRQMRGAGVRPTVESFTPVLCTLARAGQVGDALELFRQMRSELAAGGEERVDSIAWAAMMAAFAWAGRSEEAWQLYREMKAAGVQPTVGAYGALVRVLSEAGRAPEALVVWRDIRMRIEQQQQGQRMHRGGAVAGAAAAARAPGAVGLDGVATKAAGAARRTRNGRVEAGAKGLWGAAPALLPDEGIMDDLINACVRAGYFQRALEVVGVMEELGMSADRLKYRRMFIDLYCESNRHKQLSSGAAAAAALEAAAPAPASQQRGNRGVEAFKFWLGLPNELYQSDWDWRD